MWSRPRLVKRAGGEPDAVEPALVEAVARGLHRGMGDAVVGEFREQLVQRDRIGRGQRAIFVAAGRDDAGRADAGRRLAGLLPDLAGEGGDRGLAAGAGDGDHRVGLAAEEARRRQRQRQPRVVDLDAPAPPAAELGAARRDDGRSAAPCGVGGIGRAVGLRAGEREEQDARLDRRANPRKPRRRRCCRRCPPSTGRIPARSLSFIEFQS